MHYWALQIERSVFVCLYYKTRAWLLAIVDRHIECVRIHCITNIFAKWQVIFLRGPDLLEPVDSLACYIQYKLFRQPCLSGQVG